MIASVEDSCRLQRIFVYQSNDYFCMCFCAQKSTIQPLKYLCIYMHVYQRNWDSGFSINYLTFRCFEKSSFLLTMVYQTGIPRYSLMCPKWRGIPQIAKFMGPTWGHTWVLSVPDGPHVGPMNLTIKVVSPPVPPNQAQWGKSALQPCGTSWTFEGQAWFHDDVIKWKHFPRNWLFVRGIHRSPVNSPHKGQWRGALMISLICVWINDWVNNREAGDLRRYRDHYDVIVMPISSS